MHLKNQLTRSFPLLSASFLGCAFARQAHAFLSHVPISPCIVGPPVPKTLFLHHLNASADLVSFVSQSSARISFRYVRSSRTQLLAPAISVGAARTTPQWNASISIDGMCILLAKISVA